MMPIKKNSEPVELRNYRCVPDAKYDGGQFINVKDAIRRSLASEQGYLCAYCMSRIEPEENKMKVEHWHCQDNYPDEQLDYTNMLGCCYGNEGEPLYAQHCDTAKRNKNIVFNPSNPDHYERLEIHYKADGTVYSMHHDFNQQLNEVLNLNSDRHRLKANRKAVIRAIKEVLKKKSCNLTAGYINKLIKDWKSGNGKMKGYAGVAIYFLEKKLRRMSK